MFDFKAVTLEDREWVTEALHFSGRMGSESCFGNLFMWCEAYKCSIAKVNGSLVCRADDSYTLPVGGENPKAVFAQMIELARESGNGLKLHCISEAQKQEIELSMPGMFSFTDNRDMADYIYRVDDLATLKGKKYHGKRNHISFFESNFDWSYENMNSGNAKECLEFSSYWMMTNGEKADTGTDDEFYAIKKALDNFDMLGFKGGILRVQGDIIAYTFGEPISEKLFCTHVEKAVSDIRGAYPMINREFAKNTISSFELVNREEDLGIPGLRKAKESYKPEILLSKYTAQLV